ncbi:oligosaccharyl transferase subunit ost3/OST6 [Dissophora globulifera]|uniref:Oligosaccharyl transferase subunit ost3/OST6 n=1 Tax=Dissophora globulifera TaxID=979702 RepID=A0A9P6UYW0_9FUNG|nr:oligosaccharyl transferase subunit ost3/OST6 [Dissophora globulifera]
MRTHFWTSVFILAPVLVAMLVFATSIAHAQTEELLAEKVARLQTTAIRNKGIVDLESSTFDDVLAMPRNFSVVILFTAISSEFQCVPCKNFDPEYRLVASTWSKLSDKSRLFFGIIDFKKGQAIFQKFGMNSAPSVLYFSAGENQSDFDRYEFTRHGFKAEPFAAWLSAKSGVPLQVPRPFDFVAFASKLLSLLGMFIIGRFLYSQAGKILHSKHLWAAISLVRTRKQYNVVHSRHMWNQIRNPPYSMKGRDGSTGYIAAGFQNQFGLETQIIAVICRC